ncbi:glycosyltransferase [Maritimibacter alkaliphilus]|uniref:glycosyltransferase n=1 Tax=Maritimibacter alkaliphilus TaxID=404236 RepID=UPI001C95F551|nr:glycosyltransferase [Maritimibacter alkaliphilus]MBY6091428.1 putative rhamnosyl transferase [Maritimibacter alkaliphilus]
MKQVQMLGLCRFSYPTALDGFERTEGDAATNAARLYAPERLDLRLWFFEHVTLPAIRAQSDPDFTIALLAGEGLPQPYRGRLEALVADIPQVKAQFPPEGQKHRAVCKAVLTALRDPEARAVGEFTLDDDDAVAVDFVASAKRHFAAMKDIWREENRAALDYNAGLVLRAGAGGLEAEPVNRQQWAPALAIFSRPSSTRSLQDFNHRRVWSRIPTLTLPGPVMFLRGAHGGNDSSVARPGEGGLPVTDPQIAGLLQTRFAIDAGALSAAWEGLRAG